MTKLVGRAAELEEMERRFRNPNIRTLAIWGRRRVGKTALIQEFVKDKRHVILTAIEHSYVDSIRAFDESLDEFMGVRTKNESKGFPGILKRLSSVDREDERTVIIIDEYTYLCEEDRAPTPICRSSSITNCRT